MAMSKEERAVCGLKASEARYVSKITSQDLKAIMLKLVETISRPNAFTNEGLSLDSEEKSANIFSADSVSSDLLGWIIKLSYEHWSNMRTGRKTIGNLVSMYIDSHIRTVSADKLRLMTLGDVGPKETARYLKRAVQALDAQHLPPLFRYAKDYESEEDKQKRLEKAGERRAKKLAKLQQVP